MVSNKSLGIRLGISRRWRSRPIAMKISAASTVNLFDIASERFIDKFFRDSAFIDRGIAFSHATTGVSPVGLSANAFVQDAKFKDFFGSLPRTTIFFRRLRRHYLRIFKYKFRRLRRSKQRMKFYSTRQYFSSVSCFRLPRSFSISKSRVIFNFLDSKNTFKFHYRTRGVRKHLSYSFGTILISPRILKSSTEFFRLRFYTFFSKLFAKFYYRQFAVPFYLVYSHFYSRHAPADFYLNFITAKLYYKYILADVINPIVRLSSRYYRGFAITCSGRFTRAQIASKKYFRRGSIGFSTGKIGLDYSQRAVTLKYGTCNFKIWVRH